MYGLFLCRFIVWIEWESQCCALISLHQSRSNFFYLVRMDFSIPKDSVRPNIVSYSSPILEYHYQQVYKTIPLSDRSLKKSTLGLDLSEYGSDRFKNLHSPPVYEFRQHHAVCSICQINRWVIQNGRNNRKRIRSPFRYHFRAYNKHVFFDCQDIFSLRRKKTIYMSPEILPSILWNI